MKKLLLRLAVLVALVTSSICLAQLYPLFGPASGILKGNPGSPQTTTALGTDVTALFTGTVNAACFLRGDGACSSALTTSGESTVTATTATANAQLIATNGGSNAQLQLIGQNGLCFNPDNVHGCLWSIDSNGHLKLSSTGTLDTSWALDFSASTISEDVNLGSTGEIGAANGTHSHSYLAITTGTGMNYIPSNQGTTFTATLTGMTATVTVTASYSTTWNEHQQNSAFANVACVSIPATTGTSNATTFTVTGIPSTLRPFNYPVGGVTNVENNGAAAIGAWYYDNGTDSLVFATGAAGTESSFTASGTKGFPASHGFTACWETGNS